MVRTLFLGIRIEERVNKTLDRHIRAWDEKNITWTKRELRHMTLLFLGRVEDQYLPEVCSAIAEACYDKAPFEVMMNEIKIGPDKDHPKAIWLSGDIHEELHNLYTDLSQKLFSFAQIQKKQFRPHITLGRIQQSGLSFEEEDWVQTVPVQIPISVEEVTLFESVREKGELVHNLVDACELQKEEE